MSPINVITEWMGQVSQKFMEQLKDQCSELGILHPRTHVHVARPLGLCIISKVLRLWIHIGPVMTPYC